MSPGSTSESSNSSAIMLKFLRASILDGTGFNRSDDLPFPSSSNGGLKMAESAVRSSGEIGGGPVCDKQRNK